MSWWVVIFVCIYVGIGGSVNEAESKLVGGSEDVSPAIVRSQPFSPQVAFQCGYKNRYLPKDGTGEWVTDKDPHAGCLKGKLDILKYCRKVYPDLEVTNIVESSHFYEVSDWCKLDGQSCKWSFWVKPYRCIVGPFESEALLVPESCHFGHVDDRNVCKDFDHWNSTAHSECAKRPSTSSVKSFAMLDPCGLDMFSGVEFVCCPEKSLATTTTEGDELEPAINVKVKLDKSQNKFDSDDDEDDYSDEEDDDDDDLDYQTTPMSPVDPVNDRRTLMDDAHARVAPAAKTSPVVQVTTSVAETTTMDESEEDEESDEEEDDDDDSAEDTSDDQDPYFRAADPDREHGEYTLALERLEKRHRLKVAKVMKEWSELESRYQEMKEKDPNRGEQFRNEMTSRFQRTVAALEEENRDERRQIEEVHQQRVNAFLNERKRETMKAFRDALSASDPRSPTVLRMLQAYIRAEEKDRVHALNRYRRLLRTDPDLAATMKAELVKKVNDIDKRINSTIELLHDVPTVEAKVKPAILDFWKTFRSEHTPHFIDDTPLAIGDGQVVGDILLESYKKQYQDDLKGKGYENNEALAFEKTRQHEPKEDLLPSPSDGKQKERELEIVRPVVVEADGYFSSQEEMDKQRAYTEHEETKQLHAFALKETIQHDMAIKEEVAHQPQHGNRYGFVVFGIAGVTLLVAMVGAIVFVKRHFSARSQGFVKVDHCTPEERQVTAMQISGYENPTYKYFDDKP